MTPRGAGEGAVRGSRAQSALEQEGKGPVDAGRVPIQSATPLPHLMTPSRPPRPRRLRLALVLLCFCMLAMGVGRHQIESARRSLVERRLMTAVDILQDPAADALGPKGARAAFFDDLRHWAAVTGLRFTLIRPDGSVLVDTEVASGMPNLAERAEVRAAERGARDSELRHSEATGKETLYVARALESGGRRVGTLRTATDASEIDAAMAWVEATVAIVAAGCVGVGVLLGFALGRWRRERREETASTSAPAGRERVAA